MLVHYRDILAQQHWPITPALGRELLLVIDTLLTKHHVRLNELDRIAVHRGPGHYSALRHGIITAATLAYATGADLVSLSGTVTGSALVHAAQAAQPTAGIIPQYQETAKRT